MSLKANTPVLETGVRSTKAWVSTPPRLDRTSVAAAPSRSRPGRNPGRVTTSLSYGSRCEVTVPTVTRPSETAVRPLHPRRPQSRLSPEYFQHVGFFL